MPATKTIPLKTWPVVYNLHAYLQNQLDPNHEEYTIELMRSAHPKIPPANFLPAIKKAFEKIMAGKQRGRPIENLFVLHISRMPDYTWLTQEEREKYAHHYIQAVAPDGLALWSWHVNRGMGCADLNVLVPNVVDLERPRVRRQRGVNVVSVAREAADAITDMLNRERPKKKQKPIVTMPERLRQIAAAKHGACLEQTLSSHPQPVYLSNLKTVIEEMGHEVTRFNPDADYISIRFRSPEGKKKTKAKKTKKTTKTKKEEEKKPRPVRFKITALLAEVARLRDAKTHASQSPTQTISAPPPPQKPPPIIDRRSQAEIERLIDEWSQEQNPPQQRPPEPPQEPPASPERGR